MISILSIGSSKPDVIGDTAVLKAAVHPIYSTLTREYISTTRNSSVKEALANVTKTTTDLALEAASQAIERAGISKEQIGLILADCSTPVETIPGESQRLGSRLGLKIPAFDIISGSMAFVNFFETIRAWKKKKLPEYILCVSANSPTQRVNYAEGKERFHFSDGAAALIVSLQHKGKLSLKGIHSFSDSVEKGSLEIDLFGHVKVEEVQAVKNHSGCVSLTREFLKNGNREAQIFTDNFPFADMQPDFLYPKQANNLGSGVINALNDNWDKLKACDTLGLLVVSLETNGGGLVLMEVES